MRFVWLLVLLAGLAIGFGYPYFMHHQLGRDLGTWHLQDASGGFHPAVAKLAATDAPVAVTVDLTAVVPASVAAGESVLTITAASNGKTVLASAFDLAKATARDDTPQTPQQIYRFDAGVLSSLADGDYTFTAGPGDAGSVDILAVDLMLHGGVLPVDQRAMPIGISLAAVGFILFVLSLRRGGPGRTANPNSQPPPPRWGRGGGQ